MPRRPAHAFLLLTALGTATAVGAQPVTGYELFAWDTWARIDPAQHAHLASSWDRTGGHIDANQYEWPPGVITGDQDVIAATLTGPGVIQRFWMPHAAAGRPFALRMYFDGEATPRLDTDTGQLLGGALTAFAAPFLTTFAGGQVSYEPIPFRESVRIETENRAGLWHWYQHSWRRLPAGTDVPTWSGTLDPAAQAARAAAASVLQSAGDHPAGESPTAITVSLGPSVVPPGALLPVASFAGGGTLRRITLRMPGAADAALDSLRLRVRYDGAPATAIEIPVSRFFGAGHGRVPYRSLPLGTDSPQGFYCYWPMPFRAGVDVELFNDSAAPVGIAGATVENEPGDPPADAGYLYAETRSTFRITGWPWIDLVSSPAVAGHYVGNLLYVDHPTDSFQFLEGDDLVVTDGADSLHGTGLEDAYNGGFYYNWADPQPEPEGAAPYSAIRPLCGLLRMERSASPAGAHAHQYRWLIPDRVPFRESLDVFLETRYGNGQTLWTAVVFWYQTPPGPTAAPPGRRAAGGGLALDLVRPNPAGTSAVIRFTLPHAAEAVVELLDVAGRRVAVLREGPAAAGAHDVEWSRRELAGGVYFVRLTSEGKVLTRKLVLVR